MTLSQGIEVILREAVPEIVNIVDVTDHASGTNPFYEPAQRADRGSGVRDHAEVVTRCRASVGRRSKPVG